jgi:hypothetical protein
MKYSKLLKFLLAPSFMYAAGDEGGGAEDWGNEVTLGDGAPADKVDPATIVDPLKDDKVVDETKLDQTDEEKAAEALKAKQKPVPFERHDAILKKERAERAALVAELAKYKQGEQVVKVNQDLNAAETKIVGLEAEYNKLLADGEIEKATAKMSEIRRLERDVREYQSDMKVQQAEVRAVERVRYDTVVERLESAYPVLNPNDEAYDSEQVEDILDLKATYERKGLAPSAALQKAVTKMLGAGTKKQEIATEVTPNVKKEDVAAARREAALKAGIDAVNKTPASLTKVGVNSDEQGGALTAERAMAMSQKDFAAIDEKTLAKLRGDEL